MILPKQPMDLAICGQTCVAYAAQITLEQSVSLFGHTRGTSTKEVSTALRGLGYKISGRLDKRIKNDIMPRTGIWLVKIKTKNKSEWHWVIWNGNRDIWYDPARGSYLLGTYKWRTRYPSSCMLIK